MTQEQIEKLADKYVTGLLGKDCDKESDDYQGHFAHALAFYELVEKSRPPAPAEGVEETDEESHGFKAMSEYRSCFSECTNPERFNGFYDGFIEGSRWQQGQGELEALRRWKAEAMEVFNQLDLQEIGNELGITLGHSIADKVLPYIKELKARSESPATFPTREQAEKWADKSYPGDDIFAIGARKYMIEMYDWIMSKTNLK